MPETGEGALTFNGTAALKPGTYDWTIFLDNMRAFTVTMGGKKVEITPAEIWEALQK